MYVPKNQTMSCYYQENQFIRDYPFGTLVSYDANTEQQQASHIPFVIEETQGSDTMLYSHLAKANPHWKNIDNQKILIIFQGPHAYISPCWYSTQPSVPTWNYAAVHVYAKAKLVKSTRAIDIIEKTMKTFEPNSTLNQDEDTLAYQQKLMAAIAVFKFEVIKVEGKLKLGQHKNLNDQQRVYQQLANSNSVDANLLARFMDKIQCGVGKAK